MSDRLPDILARYRELNRKLEDPAVASDPARMRLVLQERGSLKATAEMYERWLAKRAEVRETESLLDDPEMREIADEELDKLRGELDELTEDLADVMAADEAEGARSVIVEIRPGTGGDEAALFAQDLFDMYQRFAEAHRFKVEILSLQVTDLGGVREAIFSIKGKDVYRLLMFESGGHRVQRVPSTETQGRIHTSAATVAVLPELEEVKVEIKDEDLKIDTMRASGPGGQKVNKTESAIRITHLPTGLVVTCQDEKSQHKNRARAMRILQGRIYDRIRQQRDSERAQKRRSLIGTGDRSQRIRTYNFPQDRCTDHRLDFNLPRLPDIMAGKLEPLIDALRKKEKAERLKGLDIDQLEETE